MKTDNELITEVINANDILVVAIFDGWMYDPERWIPPNIWLERDVNGINRTIQIRRADRTFVSTFPSLKYDTSWDCLMPVVEKIVNIGLSDTESDEVVKMVSFFSGTSIACPISGVYKRVLDFIRWYNQQK
jgi:hypothetical protein